MASDHGPPHLFLPRSWDYMPLIIKKKKKTENQRSPEVPKPKQLSVQRQKKK
jgi:hypothetical protein